MTFENTFAELWPILARRALKMTCDYDEAQDVAQMAFFKALQAWTPEHSAWNARQMTMWLYKIMDNEWCDRCRHARMRATHISNVALDDVRATSDNATETGVELRELILQTAVRLSPDLQVALTYVARGYTNRQTAKLNGTTYDTAKMRSHRAKVTFRKIWKEVAA